MTSHSALAGKRCKFALLTVLVILLGRAENQPSPLENVKISNGNLHGTGGSVHAFLGIPYAAPPVGSLRWRPPQAAASWTGTRDSTRPAHPCVQKGRPESSEDCLYLNVWTPAQRSTDHLPVMVWIHGGGFVAGAGYWPDFNGRALARKGVLVVTINYRLGVFGFLAHPDLMKESPHHASGNYGLMDQLYALQWVKTNIAAFGGDPRRITIFGESAGATSIGYLLVSPLARGLFQAAILQSPSRVLLPDPELKNTVNGLTPMEDVGNAITPHIADLRALETAEVVEKAKLVTDRLYAPGGPAKLGLRPESHVHIPTAHDVPWWAFVDGWVIPAQTETLYRQNKETVVPVLAGVNANEGSVFLRQFPVHTEQQYKEYLASNYQPCSVAMRRLYPGKDNSEIKAAADRIITDALFLYGARGILQAEARKKQKVFLYRFARISKNPERVPLGAWHGADVAYVFGSADPRVDPQGFDTDDAKVSEEIMDRWTQFAKTGNPNNTHSVTWPIWNEKTENYLEFNQEVSVHQLGKPDRFRMFQQIFSVSSSQTCQVAVE